MIQKISGWLNGIRSRVLYTFAENPQPIQVDAIETQILHRNRPDWWLTKTLPEENEIEELLHHTTPEDVFWDLGAHIGVYSAIIGQVAEYTLAVEPHPRNIDTLRHNFQLNNIPGEFTQVALSNGRKNIALDTDRNSTQFSISEVRKSGSESLKLESKPTDELLDSYPAPDIVKIDVEGSELEVLQSATNSLSESRIVQVEVHPMYGVVIEDVLETLSHLGFNNTEIKRGHTHIIRAMK